MFVANHMRNTMKSNKSGCPDVPYLVNTSIRGMSSQEEKKNQKTIATGLLCLSSERIRV